jgi:hypothetical protein
MNNFEYGFITKCAEYGVDPADIIETSEKDKKIKRAITALSLTGLLSAGGYAGYKYYNKLKDEERKYKGKMRAIGGATGALYPVVATAPETVKGIRKLIAKKTGPAGLIPGATGFLLHQLGVISGISGLGGYLLSDSIANRKFKKKHPIYNKLRKIEDNLKA